MNMIVYIYFVYCGQLIILYHPIANTYLDKLLECYKAGIIFISL